jgi:hypothetical protein
MGTTWFEDGQRRVVRRQLEKRFGPLSPAVQSCIESWSTERLDEVSLKLLEARSLDELGLGEDRPA